MSTDLESILSGQASTPAPETRTEPQPETTQEPQGTVEPSSESDPQADERGHVPVAALQAEREKGRKKYTDAVTDFEKRFSEADQRWQQRFDQLVGNLTRPQQPQPEQPATPDYWEDPAAFVQHGARQAVAPVMSQIQGLQRGMAEMQFKPEVVAEAEQAFNAAAAAGNIDPAVHARINNSPNPWAAAVQWHQQQTAMAEIGSDPAAYKAKLAEEIRAQLMAEIQQGQQAPAAQRAAPVMPSNFATGRNVGARSGPAWSGPPSLDDIFKR